jgi:hypothetical protein
MLVRLGVEQPDVRKDESAHEHRNRSAIVPE